jgi:hypothetical protein
MELVDPENMRKKPLPTSQCEAQPQILNSVDVGTGQGKYQDMLAAKYAGCVHCIVCCRLYKAPRTNKEEAAGGLEAEASRSEWVAHSPEDVAKFVKERCKKPPFQGMIEHELLRATRGGGAPKSKVVLVCRYCSSCIQRSYKPKQQGEPKPMLPMHLSIKYIMSGGCEISPNAKTLTHCIESLAYCFPNNPLLSKAHGGDDGELCGLAERIQLIIKHQELFYDETFDFLCFIRWVAEGSQHFMIDAKFAKKVRKYVEENVEVKEWWAAQAPPASACRSCIPIQGTFLREKIGAIVSPQRNKEGRGYSSVLTYSSPNPEIKISKGVDAIEEEALVVDGVSVFCTRCRDVSVISYEYDCLVKTAAGGFGITPYTDVYYNRLIKIAEFKKKSLTEKLERPAKLAKKA